MITSHVVLCSGRTNPRIRLRNSVFLHPVSGSFNRSRSNRSLKNSALLDKRAAMVGPLLFALTLVKSHHSSTPSGYLSQLVVPSYPGGTSVVTGWAACCIWHEGNESQTSWCCSPCSQSSIRTLSGRQSSAALPLQLLTWMLGLALCYHEDCRVYAHTLAWTGINEAEVLMLLSVCRAACTANKWLPILC